MPLRCDVLRIYSTHRVENSIEIHHANRLLDTYLSVSIEERFVVRFLCSPSRLRLTKLPLKKNMFQSVCGQTTRNVKSIWRNLHTKASLFTTLTLNKHSVSVQHISTCIQKVLTGCFTVEFFVLFSIASHRKKQQRAISRKVSRWTKRIEKREN